MPTVTVHDAKTNLSDLLRRVEAGEEIIIARGDKPVAILQSYAAAEILRRRKSAFGCLAGAFPLPSDEALFGPVSDEDAGLKSRRGDPAVEKPHRRARKS